jgi:hypothetical protein
MLTGITTRTSTPHEDAEPWPGGSARPVLDHLTGTLGMTGADARELLRAARTAQAATGPGALADYPLPGTDAHLLIHYAPGSRSYRFKLTASGGDETPPDTSQEPGTAPGDRPGRDGPAGGRETADDSPARDPGGMRVPGLRGAAQPGPETITVSIWHNVALDDQGRHSAMLDGYQPGDPMVRVFAYQASPGRTAEETAAEAYDTFNDHLRDSDGADLACAYYARRLRSLSVGDIVSVGEAALAVDRIGWTPVHGGLTEVRTCEHGTSPLPAAGRAPECAALPAGRGNAGTGECGAPLTLGPQHDPYRTTCDQAEGHYPGTDHTGPHPLGTRPGDRITWQGGGRCAGDSLPYEITSEAWQEDQPPGSCPDQGSDG